MLINKQQSKKRSRKPYEWWMAIAVILLFLLFSFYQWSQQQKVEQSFFCDMENKSIDGRKFLSGGHTFTNGHTQSEEKSFEGQYASKCTAENLYGAGIKIEGLNEGDVIEASIWRQSDEGYGVLAFQGFDGWTFYDYANEVVETRKGWERIMKKVRIPIGARNVKINIYPYNTTKKGAVYFDNLSIKYYPPEVYALQPPVQYDGPDLTLQVDKKELKQLRQKRVEAFTYGNLLSGKDDLVRAKLIDDSTEVDVKIRLKGDLLDHLQSKKWSFRIVPDKGQSWNGMTEFSVHNSLSRSQLNEWVYHQMLHEEDVMTTKYDFIKLSLNEDPLGIYAYEEHFGANVIRQQGRPPGPILRFNEDGLWIYAPKNIGDRPDWFYSADISLYDSKDILGQQESYKQYIQAQDLLYSFVQGKKPPTAVFDIDRLAKALAIQDVCVAHHSFIFTNVRFYFNPVTGLIEPIGYDGYTDFMEKQYGGPIMSGAYINARTPKDYASTQQNAFFHKPLFTNYEFAEKYAYYLNKFSSKSYIDSFLSKYIMEIQAREKFIQLDYPGYKFEADYFFRNAANVQMVIPPMTDVSLKAYKSNPSSSKADNSITLESFHQLPLQILGAGDEQMTISAPEDLILESFNETYPARRYTWDFSGKAKNIFFKTLGTDSISIQPIAKWEIPKKAATTIAKANFQKHNYIRLGEDGNLYFKPGTHQVNNTITIPEGHLVIIPSGTTLEFKNGAALQSYAPIKAIGTFEKPIRFTSSDGRGQGIFIINAKEQTSAFEHCAFVNLSAFRKNGQYAEGSVTAYDSKVSFKNCVFAKSNAKDALQLIRSEYDIKDCIFKGMQSDGIDADYSFGKMNNLSFENIGKDAIEISGGTVDLDLIAVDQALGSGIKATLHARIRGKSIVIKNSKVGITANDLSKIGVEKVELENVAQGFVAYQQLDNYGGGRLDIKDYTAKEVKKLVVVDEVSEVRLKGKGVE